MVSGDTCSIKFIYKSFVQDCRRKIKLVLLFGVIDYSILFNYLFDVILVLHLVRACLVRSDIFFTEIKD